MRNFVSEGFGRIVVLNFERGEKLLEGIKNELKNLSIKNALLVSGIGTFEKARIHRVTSFTDKPEEEFITIDAPMELSSIQGLVVDGEPHFHMVFSDLEKTYSGHLEDGSIVLYLAEIVLLEIKNLELTRSMEGHVKLLHSK